VKLPSTDVTCIALKSILLKRLQEAIYFPEEILRRDKVSDLSKEGYLPEEVEQPQTIPLTKISKDTFEIEYASAIALKGVKLPSERRLSELPGELSVEDTQRVAAQTIGARLTNSIMTVKNRAETCQRLPDAVWRSVTIQVVSSGWIYLRLGESGLAEWLQALAEQPIYLGDRFSQNDVHENNNQLLRNSTKLFELQHTYARCCSQIWLAQQAGLLSPLSPSSLGGNFQKRPVITSNRFPWMDSNHLLRLQHPSERQLVSQLVTAVDSLSEASPSFQSSSLKIGQALSQSFLKFHAACRIFAEIKAIEPDLARARLGLVLATRTILKTLLEEGLGACAPPEL
jgi:hypothetical protein